MIRLRGHTLGEARSFIPLSYSPTLTDKGGSATMTVLPGEEELPIGTWLRDNHAPEAGTVWRVTSQETDRNTGIVTYGLEHIIQTLEDQILTGEFGPGEIRSGASQVSARRAAEFAMGFQDIWQLGDCEFDLTAPFSFNRDTVLDALETVTRALDGAVWEFDLTETPFTLHIRKEKTEAACEMRRGRNLTKLNIRTDKARMYTRIYPIGKNDLELPEKYLSRNEEIWGRVDHPQTDQSIDSVNMLRIWAAGLLRKHCEPGITVTGAGLYISEATGEPLDRLTVGRVCRVPDPDSGNTISARIVKIQWRDKIREPENVTVTLSNDEEDVARIVNRMQKGGGGGGRADAKNAKEDHAWFVDTEDHVAMVAEAIIGKDPEHPDRVDWSRVATVIVDGNGIHNRVTAAEGEIVVQQAQIDINENRILQEVTDRSAADQTLSARITTTADEISAEVTRARANEDALSGRITVNADKVGMVVEEKNGQNVIKAASIVASINDSGSQVAVNADKILMGVSQDDLDTWAAGAEGLIAARATIGDLNAVKARISSIEADYITADEITGDFIAGKLTSAQTLFVGTLYATSLRVNNQAIGNNNIVANVSAVQNSDGTVTFKQYRPSGDVREIITFSPAASATLTGSWSGATYTAIATDASGTEISRVSTTISLRWNGNSLEAVSGNDLLTSESFTFTAAAGVSTAGGLTTIDTFKDHKAYGLVTAAGLGPLRRFQVDATSEYNAGVTAGRSGVTLTKGTWQGGSIAVTASNGKSETIGMPAVTLSEAPSWSGHKKNVYAASSEAGISGPIQTIEIDATSEYNAGVTAGRSGVTLTKGTWQGGSISVTASNGASESISFPAVTMDEDSSWSSHKKWVYAYSSAAGITGYVKRLQVDATSEYNAGVTAGEAKFSRAALTLQGEKETIVPIGAATKYASVKRYKGDGGGYYGRGVAVSAYIKTGNTYTPKTLYAGDGVYHYDRGHEETVLVASDSGSLVRYAAGTAVTRYKAGTAYTTSNSPYYTKN